MATFSYFLDRLSAETRVLIYGFVFGDSDHARRATPAAHVRQKHEDLFDTSIFAVNKQVRDEALETFYNSKTIRLTVPELYTALWTDGFTQLARKVQITDCIHLPSAATLQYVLRNALRLPRIRSVAIASDCLSYIPKFRRREDDHEKGSISVRQFVADMGLGEVTITDIGRYSLQGEYRGVDVVNTKLLRMWPTVRGTPDDYDAFRIAEDLISEWGVGGDMQMLIARVAQTSLQLWVGLFQACVDMADGNDVSNDVLDPRRIYGASFIRSMRSGRIYMRAILLLAKANILHKLGPGQDPAILEEVTEWLSLNVAAYFGNFMTPDGEAELLSPCHWCEVIGGEPVGLLYARWRRDAIAADHAQYHVDHPTEQGISWRIDAVREWMAHFTFLGFDSDRMNNMDIEEVKEHFYPFAAAGFVSLNRFDFAYSDPEGYARYQDWTLACLRTFARGCLPVMQLVIQHTGQDMHATVMNDLDNASHMDLLGVYMHMSVAEVMMREDRHGDGEGGGKVCRGLRSALTEMLDVETDEDGGKETDDEEHEARGVEDTAGRGYWEREEVKKAVAATKALDRNEFLSEAWMPLGRHVGRH